MDKIKITQKEIDELYDISQDKQESDKVVKDDEISPNATFEEVTEIYDKKQMKEFMENGSG